jgi:hypothetical protein
MSAEQSTTESSEPAAHIKPDVMSDVPFGFSLAL